MIEGRGKMKKKKKRKKREKGDAEKNCGARVLRAVP